MGNHFSFASNMSESHKIGYEDMQYAIKQPSYMIINTLKEQEQDCLITNTIRYDQEEQRMNQCIRNGENGTVCVIIYGRHCNDEGIYKKYNQLVTLGFVHLYIYTGGLFEWLLLQDVYGASHFPTTRVELDILKYRPMKVLSSTLLMNGRS
jgi:hypothetical protein